MCCISTTLVSILINGCPTTFFSPTRGIRQGDPLSPYIFILCMERLSRRVDMAVDYLLWSPVKVAPHSPPISHLFFVDDMILCGEITPTTCDNISTIMRHFSSISGQQINYAKSRIFFSKNTSIGP